MYNKKSKYPGISEKKHINISPEVMELLELLHQKVLSSQVLNGGFDTMMLKVELIEEGQKHVGSRVDSIYEAIYDPQEGLFARVNEVERVKEKVALTDKLEKDVVKLQQWHDVNEKTVEKTEKQTKEKDDLLNDHVKKIEDLLEFKKKVNSIVKWSFVTLMGSAAPILGKLIYDFVSGHITVH